MIQIGKAIINGRHVQAITEERSNADIAHPKVFVLMEGGLQILSDKSLEDTVQLVQLDVLNQVERESIVMNRVSKEILGMGEEDAEEKEEG